MESHFLMRSPAFMMILLLLHWAVLATFPAAASEAAAQDVANAAPLVFDGKQLFLLRGVTSYPAQRRAEFVHAKITEAADDESVSVDELAIVDSADRTGIYAGKLLLINVFDVDAEFEGVDRRLLATAYLQSISDAIRDYRLDRSPAVLLENTGFALVATIAMVLLLWATTRLSNWLDAWAVRHVQRNLEHLAHRSHQLIRAAQVWRLVAGALRVLRFLVLLLLVYSYLNTVLGLYPWTRPAALVLFDLVLEPMKSLWLGFVGSIPDLSFLVVLGLVVRYVLVLTRAFFNGVASGSIKLENFDPEWSAPTYKIVRTMILAFAIVIAYPYIPGSDSAAFKGVSLFLGVILSLGSSSFIANVLAGLAMTYRGAFKEGDRIRIDDVVGRVESIKLMTTRILTAKNEIVVIPNLNILNINVVNFSVMAREKGVVLHTSVGVGYDAPWRQVEAMLLIAAARTQGLKADPAPFVLQQSLGDFAVNYELNVYCTDDSRIP